MITFTHQLLSDQRKKVLALDEMEILNARGIMTSRGKSIDTIETGFVEGSFRKLEID
jgi:hypothetical protein